MQIRGVSFKDCVEYDYDYNRDCESYGCDSICRCGRIEDAHVTSVNISLMVHEIRNSYFSDTKSSKRNSKINFILGNITDDIDIYTIDRILRINKAYYKSNWEVQVCGGYYGEEIDDVILEDSLAQQIENQLEEAFNITNLSLRMEYLLQLEYGYILPDIKGKKYEITHIERDKVIFGSDNQYNKVASEELPHYSDKIYNSFRGIVIQKGDQYRIIDGYHRCFASENRMISVIKVV